MTVVNQYTSQALAIPESYNELTTRQLLKVVKLLNQEESDELVRKLKCLQILLDVGALKFFLLPIDTKFELLDYSEWVFEQNNLTKNLLPSYRKLYGPKDEFNNLVLKEFHWTEVFYYDLVHANSDEEKAAAENNLIAVLYRPAKPHYDQKRDPDGDIRIKFNLNELRYYSRKISYWPAPIKAAVLLYYDGCREYITKLYDKVFTRTTTQQADTEAGMFDVMRGLAGNKYGDFEKVEYLNLHTSLTELEKTIDEAAKYTATQQTPTTTE